MKWLTYLIVLSFVAWSCKPSTADQNKQNEPGSIKSHDLTLQNIAARFPADKLDELVETISQEELAMVINDGESKGWTRSALDNGRPEIVIKSKLASDNSVRFVMYPGAQGFAMLGVQQENAQVVATEVWEYRSNVSGDHPEQWNQYLLPEYKLENFFDERVVLPDDFNGNPAKPYLNYHLELASVTVSLNKWLFMREMDNNSMPLEGALDPTLVKYKFVLGWNGDSFVEEKVMEPGYSDILTFTSHVVEPLAGGPGPHEFDCGHGVSIKSSSTLTKQGANSYSASNMIDGADATAWSEGVSGDGVGEWIEFTITDNFRIGFSWQIGNGYNRSKETWQANNRVKKMKVLVDDQVVGYIMLANVSVYQSFDIAPYWLKDSPEFKKGTTIKFVIAEVYKGSKYDDTLISYFMPIGNCG